MINLHVYNWKVTAQVLYSFLRLIFLCCLLMGGFVASCVPEHIIVCSLWLMVSAARQWFPLGNGYHLWGDSGGGSRSMWDGVCLSCLAFSDCLEMGVVQRSAVPILLFLFFFPPVTPPTPCLTFQPFEFIFLWQGPRGHSLYFGAIGKTKLLCLNGCLVPPDLGLPLVIL